MTFNYYDYSVRYKENVGRFEIFSGNKPFPSLPSELFS